MTEPVQSGSVGASMFAFVEELYPICRSITGDGFRESLRRIASRIPLTVSEVPSGMPVFDWTVPLEWNIRDAWIADAAGRRVVDFAQSSLHVMSYSTPVRAQMSLAELRPHLHSLPDQPELIPYRTSYYSKAWGFCLSQRVLDSLRDDEMYDVCIDSTLEPGSLTYGECVIPGESDEEVLVSCHCCHPSLANDNLSGMSIAVELARELRARPERPRYTYRFVFIPGTIGSITWLARNREATTRIRHGLVLSCLGDPGPLTYKRSRQGKALVDRAVEHVLRTASATPRVRDFVPYGYDERQYCSPGFDLPVGCLTRTPNGEYPEYHTSADNLQLVRPEHLANSYEAVLRVVEVLEHDRAYVNLNPHCEPQLGRRGLYRKSGGQSSLPNYEMALLWVLNFSDGRHTLLDIADRSALPFSVIRKAADDLARTDLLARAPHTIESPASPEWRLPTLETTS